MSLKLGKVPDVIRAVGGVLEVSRISKFALLGVLVTIIVLAESENKLTPKNSLPLTNSVDKSLEIVTLNEPRHLDVPSSAGVVSKCPVVAVKSLASDPLKDTPQ